MAKFRSVLVLFMIGLLVGCGIDRTIMTITAEEQLRLLSYSSMEDAHKLVIADSLEAGERLILCLTFVNKENQRPLIDQEVLFYHTSADGEYNPTNPSDETTARLSGRAITNSQGRVFLRTILPGDYGSSADNRHIHTNVFEARPEAYDVHFEQYTGFMGRRSIEKSDQHFLANLRYTQDSVLVGFLTIEVKNLIPTDS